MRKKLFQSMLLTSISTMLFTAIVIVMVVYANSEAVLEKELQNEAVFVSEALNSLGDNYQDYIVQIGTGLENRITLIGADGQVIYDNYALVASMDNHLNRPEIRAALREGAGEAIRQSATLGEKIYYYAVQLQSGEVLRIANTTKSAFGLLSKAALPAILLIGLIWLIGLFLARRLTSSMVKPLAELNLETPLENQVYEELSPLLTSLEHKNQEIKRQFTLLSEQQREFDYITSNMSEGLVVFGQGGKVLSLNASAKKILGGEGDGSYLKLCRDLNYIKAVETALKGQTAQAKMVRNQRIYQLTVSPVEKELAYAAVLFMVDITDREQSEQVRREFSANVSHELKTPLTSILGCAEIIGNGIAKTEDIPRFAAQIHQEAARLLNLIEDIIRLSRLDEDNLKAEFEPVELAQLCQTVLQELADKARNQEIALSFSGEEAQILGFKPVLHEMLFNLCDNALIYNQPGGKVEISLRKEADQVILAVADTGIGLAPEQQERVFERFYRVDQSHSKATGGTGLGLSIVKHGAILHGAEISLQSQLGQGTVISLEFKTR